MTGISEMLMDAGTASQSIAPANFDAFSKAIAVFTKTVRPRFIDILNSKLLATDEYGQTTYGIDFSSVFRQPQNMSFLNIKEEIKALEGLGGNSDVLLLEDDGCYYLAGEIGVVPLTKYRGTAPKINLPDLKESDQMGKTVTISDTDSLSKAVRGSKWTGLFTHDGQLIGFITSNFMFRLFHSESSNLIRKTQDAMYKAHSFLKMAGSTVHLGLYNLDGEFWLKTSTDIAKPRKGGQEEQLTNAIGPPVTIYERLIPAGLNEFQRLFSLLSKNN